MVPINYAVAVRQRKRTSHQIVQVPIVASLIVAVPMAHKRKVHQQRNTVCRIAMITKAMMILWTIGMETCRMEAMRKIIGKIGRTKIWKIGWILEEVGDFEDDKGRNCDREKRLSSF